MKFYHQDIEIEVSDNVYYPMEDSLLLAKALEKMDLRDKKCLDMGCGSGFLAILLAKKGAAVTATDISEAAVAVAIENARHNKADIEFFLSDLFEKAFLFGKRKDQTQQAIENGLLGWKRKTKGKKYQKDNPRHSAAKAKSNEARPRDYKFDLIVFNPPHLPVKDKYTHESFSGGRTGRQVIERFLKQAKNHLKEGGKILLLISSLTGEKEVIAFAKQCGFKARVLEREKLDWEEIIVMGLEERTG